MTGCDRSKRPAINRGPQRGSRAGGPIAELAERAECIDARVSAGSALYVVFSVVATLLLAAAGPFAAQQGRGGGPPPTAQAAAPLDLTGYWVSIVSEDWLWRMITPPKGDVASIPLNPAGRKIAEAWDLAKDNAS